MPEHVLNENALSNLKWMSKHQTFRGAVETIQVAFEGGYAWVRHSNLVFRQDISLYQKDNGEALVRYSYEWVRRSLDAFAYGGPGGTYGDV